jgi:hypothetical protein
LKKAAAGRSADALLDLAIVAFFSKPQQSLDL